MEAELHDSHGDDVGRPEAEGVEGTPEPLRATVLIQLLDEAGRGYDSVAALVELDGAMHAFVARGYRTEPGAVPALVEVPIAVSVRLA